MFIKKCKNGMHYSTNHGRYLKAWELAFAALHHPMQIQGGSVKKVRARALRTKVLNLSCNGQGKLWHRRNKRYVSKKELKSLLEQGKKVYIYSTTTFEDITDEILSKL